MVTLTPQELRSILKSGRESFIQHPNFATAQENLGKTLCRVVEGLRPTTLGLYWPLWGEFDCQGWLSSQQATRAAIAALALPYARIKPIEMHYALWDGTKPRVVDECGIPSAGGAFIVPDVILVPCLGFNCQGYRLGYGLGYFDRWLCAHPQVTAIGLAWAHAELASDKWQPQAHDQALSLILTEREMIKV